MPNEGSPQPYLILDTQSETQPTQRHINCEELAGHHHVPHLRTERDFPAEVLAGGLLGFLGSLINPGLHPLHRLGTGRIEPIFLLWILVALGHQAHELALGAAGGLVKDHLQPRCRPGGAVQGDCDCANAITHFCQAQYVQDGSVDLADLGAAHAGTPTRILAAASFSLDSFSWSVR